MGLKSGFKTAPVIVREILVIVLLIRNHHAGGFQNVLKRLHMLVFRITNNAVHIKDNRSQHNLFHQGPQPVRKIGGDGVHAARHHALHFIFGVAGPGTDREPRLVRRRDAAR